MFGKFKVEKGRTTVVLNWRFNPRVRGTCLVSSHMRLHHMHVEERFNPRVRGTCLVSPTRRQGEALAPYKGVVSIPVCGEHVW